MSQYDMHISEMTVRETLDFSACCQGIGSGSEILMEIIRREKRAGIIPERDIDTYMKATSIEGLNKTLRTDYTLKILGLDNCADIIAGNAMRTGISGGQKRRLTTGEMIIGPSKVLLMDEISTGLDSATTFQIVTCFQQWTHTTGSTIVLSLLQPEPEVFELFDDIILMAEGKIAYQGPCDCVVEFFEHCGFRCPPGKGIADFLQEVVSRKDQGQYWYPMNQTYTYVSVEDFEMTFKKFHVGQKLDEQLSQDFIRSDFYKKALSFNIYSLRKWKLLKACTAREWLLMRRNSVVYVVRSVQLGVIALIAMTTFLQPRMDIDVDRANYFMGSLFFALMRITTNGIPELAMTLSRLPVFYKQRDIYFYPAWAYSIPAAILKIPYSFVDAFLWTALTYYVIGYSPEPERFFRQFFILFLLHQVSISWFRLVASVFRNPSVAVSYALFSIAVMFYFGGFLIPQPSLPTWLKWGFWVSPLAYAEIGASVNEFLAPRWQKVRLKSLMKSTHQMPRYIFQKKGEPGFETERLQLLKDVTGTFRAGVLTALMGASGAGKTTLMDVLSGRKTCGIIEGDIRIGGYPKVQDTYVRISGYCKQSDIHSPQITILESLTYSAWLRLPPEIDRNTKSIMLMKRGGQIIFLGELGKHSSKLIAYFEGISGVPKIQENYNPATWMLEVTSPSAEAQLGLDFACLYEESNLYQETKELVRNLSIPAEGSAELHFSTSFTQNGWEQFKACLWKQHLSYWRSPEYNLVRLVFITMISLFMGAVLWQKGREIAYQNGGFGATGYAQRPGLYKAFLLHNMEI
ncbi:hypothetical protein RHMOL_Rhmol08G0090400 [Rhododendron molle]|uniref:Uncharacterized protein n=1 Tax=Rhododendron molle TaxID=49168 RepID=A0ACC0MLF5_RHOML|nr:hypothetical protein RHMOL_Rhmol08G0090400 [Rhododendron molle]